MNLYNIHLPLTTNENPEQCPSRRSYAPALARWEALALATAGGYTRLGETFGAWREGARDYMEPMAVYQIACKPDVFDGLVRLAFHYFPDQAAIFTAHIGQANIINRSKTP